MGFPIAPRTGTAPANPAPEDRDALLASDPSAVTGIPALDRVACWLAVVGGAGHVPVAPGTMGSLVAVVAFGGAVYGLRSTSAVLLSMGLFVVIAATLALGTWAAGRAESVFGRHDDGRIVIDEVVGQWITLVPIVAYLPVLDFSGFRVALVTGFVAFRVFDIWKPGAVRWAERRFEGGLGVMADDVVAGVYGALVLTLGLASGLFDSLSGGVLSGGALSGGALGMGEVPA